MALIDTLPLFSVKPLSLDKESKLSPKPELIDKRPWVLPIITSTKSASAVGTTQPAQPVPPSNKLPAVYKEYEPLVQALNDSAIINPRARAAVVAQMGLERGWKAPSDYNYGNITAGGSWAGTVNVRGNTDAKGNKITQRFRVYGSAKEFVDDYIALLRQSYPQAYSELLSDNFDIDRFTSGLVDGKRKYAEDPSYKSKVKRVYNSVEQQLFGTKQ